MNNNYSPNDIIKAHFSRLGKKGARNQKKKYPRKQFAEWGKLGGRPRKKAVDN